MLPKVDGFAVAKEIRQQNSQIPMLFLSAKSLKEDRIAGLAIGADDYVTKPFSIEELVLKVDIFLRRSKLSQPVQTPSHGLLTIGDYRFNQGQQQLIYHSEIRDLTQREALLGYLHTHVNQVVKREDILATIWVKMITVPGVT